MRLWISIISSLIAASSFLCASDAFFVQVVPENVFATEATLGDEFGEDLEISSSPSNFRSGISVFETRIYDVDFIREIEEFRRPVTISFFDSEGRLFSTSVIAVSTFLQQGDPKGRCSGFSFSVDLAIIKRVVIGIYSGRRFSYFRMPLKQTAKAEQGESLKP